MYLAVWDFWLKSKFLKIEISVLKLEIVNDRSQVQANTEKQWHDVHHKCILSIQHIQLRNEFSKAFEAKE